MKNEDGDILLATKPVDGGTEIKQDSELIWISDPALYSPASISTGRSNDGQLLRRLPRTLFGISSKEEELEKIAEELEGNVLESKGGPVEEFQNEGLVIQLDEWSHIWMSERAVRLLDEGLQFLLGDFF